MLAFSSAFSLPFFLLALLPQWLNRLPKAGSWLLTVKAYMGFLELAAALKFFSNVELSFNLPPERAILTQPAFLAVWFTIFIVAACCMMGWLRLPHGDPDMAIGPLRRAIGIATAVLGVYCLMGVNGGSLGWFAGLLPPSNYGLIARHAEESKIAWEKDLDAAFARASAENKLLMVNFTGIYCTNCRTMEESVFTRPEVAAKINEFLPLELYTDRGDAESNKNQAFQQEHFQQVTLPLYAVMTPDRRIVESFALDSLPADLSVTARKFNEFLESAKAKESSQASG
jgi:thiol:disulfide interchange protein DsbD